MWCDSHQVRCKWGARSPLFAWMIWWTLLLISAGVLQSGLIENKDVLKVSCQLYTVFLLPLREITYIFDGTHSYWF